MMKRWFLNLFGCAKPKAPVNGSSIEMKAMADVNAIVKSCTSAIEEHGVVQGIYRVSAGTSKINSLRTKFSSTSEEVDLEGEHPHTIAAVLKEYVRKIPGSVLGQVEDINVEGGLEEIRRYVEDLPLSHYKTAKYILGHLSRLSKEHDRTGMTTSNLAVVWGPNLLRMKESEDPLKLQTAFQRKKEVAEFMIANYDEIFFPSTHFQSTKSAPLTQAISSSVAPETILSSIPTSRNENAPKHHQVSNASSVPIVKGMLKASCTPTTTTSWGTASSQTSAVLPSPKRDCSAHNPAATKPSLPAAHSAPTILSTLHASTASTNNSSDLPPWLFPPYKWTPITRSYIPGVRFLPKYDIPIEEVIRDNNNRSKAKLYRASLPPKDYSSKRASVV